MRLLRLLGNMPMNACHAPGSTLDFSFSWFICSFNVLLLISVT